ncbi:MAG: HAMP domain-containing sensor histidine kinase [Chloroflexota bacterium]
MALGSGATVSTLAARLGRMGLHTSEVRVRQLLDILAVRGLVRSRPRDDDAFSATTAGLTQIAAVDARVAIGDELAELERLRTQLLGVVGHELRTPLTSIRTSVGLLQDPVVRPSAAEHDRLLANIAAGAERIQHLVADVLDIARFRSGDVRLQLSAFDPAELAESARGAMTPALAQKGQHLTIEIGARPLVYGDRARLRQVLLKLLGNAHRFAPAGAAIRMTLTARGSDVVWSIADGGPGIPAEDLPRLFERFFAANGPGPARSGAGLGLPISLAIARAHGGTIEVDSAPGVGSTFRLRVPIRAQEEAES